MNGNYRLKKTHIKNKSQQYGKYLIWNQVDANLKNEIDREIGSTISIKNNSKEN